MYVKYYTLNVFNCDNIKYCGRLMNRNRSHYTVATTYMWNDQIKP